jgi:hypothetical protein
MGHLVGLRHVEDTQQLSHRVSRVLPKQQSMQLAEHEQQLAMTSQQPMCSLQSQRFRTMQSQATDES